jgi:hypothetical protein
MHKALNVREVGEERWDKKSTMDLVDLSSTKSLKLTPMDSWTEQSNMTYKYTK